MGDWSMLPCELLGEIGLKLDSAEDVGHFSAVCSSWNCAYSSIVKKEWTPRMPWLMLPEKAKEKPDNYLRKLFCPSSQRSYKLELPQTFGARCWGTSSGWIVTIDLNLELYLFNPFTRVRIRLPPQSTMPRRSPRSDRTPESLRRSFIDKAYIFYLDDDDFIVVALYGGVFDAGIAYVRPGDEAWTSVTTLERCVHDIVRWGYQLLIVYSDGKVGCCDISAFQNSQPVTVMESEYLPSLPIVDLAEYGINMKRFYMLKCFGCLLLVLRCKEEVWDHKNDPEGRDSSYRTTGFDVFAFDFRTRNWEMVDDLGDFALFVGNNNSLSVDASAAKNCKRNCIYFPDDETQFWPIPQLGGHDMGIFHLENKEIEPFYEGDDIRSGFCTAIWFVPNSMFG